MSKLGYRFSIFMKSLSDRKFKSAIQFLKHVESINDEEFDELKRDLIKDQLIYCINHVPFYRNLNLSEEAIIEEGPYKVLSQLPLLTKDVVRANHEALKADSFSQILTSTRRSGGTTGEPIEASVDGKTQALETMSYFRGLQWMGWQPGMAIVKFAGGSLGFGKKFDYVKKARDHLIGQYRLPAFELNDDTIEDYVKAVRNKGPCILVGYASTLFNLAHLMDKHHLSLDNVEMGITTAELLTPDWAKYIKNTLNCPVKSYYGCGEIESLGYQMEEFGDYVVPDEINMLESLEYDKLSYLAVSSLHNKAKPFLRYVNGDIGEIGHEKTGGKTRLVIKQLEGRSSDILFNVNNSPISGILGTHLVYKTGISVKKYQFIQHQLDEIEFRYVPEESTLPEEEKAKVQEVLNNTLGGKIKVNFVETDEFITSPTGKHRITINKM